MARIFLSYRRVAPDDSVARRLYRGLSDIGHDVFIDSPGILIGERWPATIRARLERAEWFVCLVSLSYLHSPHCVDEELLIAIERLRKRELEGMIPVRMAFDGEFPAAVRRELDEIQSATWRGPDDTARVLDALSAHLPRPTLLVKGMRAFAPVDGSGSGRSAARWRSTESWSSWSTAGTC